MQEPELEGAEAAAWRPAEEEGTSGRRMTPRRIFWRWLEIAGLAVYLVSALAIALFVPPGTPPDEGGHVNYVLAIASGQGLPLPALESHADVESDRIVYFSAQAHHPPVYYALLAPLALAVNLSPPLVIGYGRVIGLLFGLGAILLTRAAARRLFPERDDALALGVFFAGTFITYDIVMASLNNETLAVLLVALAIYCAARLLSSPSISALQCFLMGVLLGLAVDVKLTAAVAAVPLVAVLVAAHRKDRSRRRTTGRALAACTGVLLLAAPWYVPYAVQSGGVAFNLVSRPAFTTPWGILAMPGQTVAALVGIAEELLAGLWWPNWLLRDWPAPINAWLLGAVDLSGYAGPLAIELAQFTALAAGWFGLRRVVRELDPEQEGDRHARLFLATLAWLVPVFFVGIVWQALFVDVWMVRWAPRYAPVFLPSLGILLGMGYMRLVPPRYARWGAVAIALAALAVNGVALSRLGVLELFGL